MTSNLPRPVFRKTEELVEGPDKWHPHAQDLGSVGIEFFSPHISYGSPYHG